MKINEKTKATLSSTTVSDWLLKNAMRAAFERDMPRLGRVADVLAELLCPWFELTTLENRRRACGVIRTWLLGSCTYRVMIDWQLAAEAATPEHLAEKVITLDLAALEKGASFHRAGVEYFRSEPTSVGLRRDAELECLAILPRVAGLWRLWAAYAIGRPWIELEPDGLAYRRALTDEETARVAVELQRRMEALELEALRQAS